MLLAIELQDFAIIDSLRLELGQGFNVLTGETGAGKSILIDALTLLIGGRADNSMIRTGKETTLIQAEFSVCDTESISRRLKRGGRGTGRINGEIVKMAEIAETGKGLIAIHGQHASQTLTSSNEQRKLLDKLLDAKSQQQLATYNQTYTSYQQAKKELETLQSAVSERAQRLDILQFQISEIDDAKLVTGEESELQEQVENLRHAERIMKGVGGALGVLAENEENVLNLLTQALKDLNTAARHNKDIAQLNSDLENASASLQAVSNELANFLIDFEVEPGALEKLQSYLSTVEKLKLKYGKNVEAVLAYRDRAAKELESLKCIDDSIDTLTKSTNSLATKLNKQANNLSEARKKVAKALSKQVTQQIRPLGMKNADFTVKIEPLEKLTVFGKDKITFLFSANLGEPLSPLANVASGGELSRVMLGLNVVSGSELPTLIFDEVDAGIGGQAARSVGALLKQLASKHQVLAVTHLPQVAAYADSHFYVEKAEQKGRTITRISCLQGQARAAELARMLSGAVTSKALAHARELLEEARNDN